MKKVFLLKDLPELSAGAVFEYDKKEDIFVNQDQSGGVYRFPLKVIEKNKDWFGGIKDYPK